MQLFQFTAIFAQSLLSYRIGPTCGSPDFAKLLMIVYMGSMVALFSNFFLQRYILQRPYTSLDLCGVIKRPLPPTPPPAPLCGTVRLTPQGTAVVTLPPSFRPRVGGISLSEEDSLPFAFLLTPIGAPMPNLHVAKPLYRVAVSNLGNDSDSGSGSGSGSVSSAGTGIAFGAGGVSSSFGATTSSGTTSAATGSFSGFGPPTSAPPSLSLPLGSAGAGFGLGVSSSSSSSAVSTAPSTTTTTTTASAGGFGFGFGAATGGAGGAATGGGAGAGGGGGATGFGFAAPTSGSTSSAAAPAPVPASLSTSSVSTGGGFGFGSAATSTVSSSASTVVTTSSTGGGFTNTTSAPASVSAPGSTVALPGGTGTGTGSGIGSSVTGLGGGSTASKKLPAEYCTASVESIINKWKHELTDDLQAYTEQSQRISVWDDQLRENQKTLMSAIDNMQFLMNGQEELERSCDAVEAYQNDLDSDLEALERMVNEELAKRENEDPTEHDWEREKTYSTAAELELQLTQMHTNTTAIVENVNRSRKGVCAVSGTSRDGGGVNNPVPEILEILNTHQNTLTW
eukprot:CAMPEP_0182419908 /NCGR_PEP_ID=MMETSP1167-20130531/4246_1 /TAXON_ID=2988 /ORGANISM="Mallomonas Sp, Strain CCMP3275" /LENGTH=566 /DNA_ID=CAMNT_0024595065 /DNA_START=174 /DNA_END=1871 /DNA_ORIENTATION=-